MSGTAGTLRNERQVLAAVARLASAAGLADDEELHPAAASELLRRIADAGVERGAGQLALDALDLEQELSEHIIARRARRRASLERGLARLRPVTDRGELIDRACNEAVRSCGVQRVLLSGVRDGRWTPVRWSTLGDGSPWRLPRAIEVAALPLEAEVIEGRRPLLTTTARTDGRVHDELRRTMGDSYCVAPIALAGFVIGLLHLDRAGERRGVDEDDRDLAWAFSEGFGRIYEHSVLRERLARQRELVLGANQSALETVSPITGPIELAAGDVSGRGAVTTAADATAQLTGREREVADLMAAGLGNAEIGRRLVIERATVKSHARAILRKLGAANRSQAVAMLLRPG